MNTTTKVNEYAGMSFDDALFRVALKVATRPQEFDRNFRKPTPVVDRLFRTLWPRMKDDCRVTVYAKKPEDLSRDMEKARAARFALKDAALAELRKSK
ncbi:hypothetical protein [Acinetobacter sp.]|uniref:hypothetical protein n=1 Tax=Acinetobacter sp. TaxID=472 RepID=UPI003D05DAB3